MPIENQRPKRVLFTTVLAVLAGAAAGCGPETTPGSRLVTTRVLGARIVAGGDPARTWPRPGEAVSVSWVVAAPRPRSLAWSFRTAACAASMDDDACAASGPVVPATSPDGGRGQGDGLSPPVLALAAPATAGAGGAANRLLVSGVICAGGAVGDPSASAWSRCAPATDDGLPAVDETDVRLTVWLQLGEAGNAPPSVAGAAITWAGDAWQSGTGDPTFTSSGGPCAGDASMPQVVRADDEERDVVVTMEGANRESIAGTAGSATREEALVSAFTTLGSFATQFGTVTASDERAATPVRFKWTAPSASDAQLDQDGRVVRFVFVVRDGRGGLDATTRTLCLVPPAPKT